MSKRKSGKSAPCSDHVVTRTAQAMCDLAGDQDLCTTCALSALTSAVVSYLSNAAEQGDLERAKELANAFANRLLLAASAETVEAFSARLFADVHAPGVH